MKLVFLFLLVLPMATVAQVVPLINAHAHNDYEHRHPLFDALDAGFNEVEADVFLINGELHVAHIYPLIRDSNRTLKRLYLEPLKARISANKGHVFPGETAPFYLMIDVKKNADATFRALKQQLWEYRDMICLVRNGQAENSKPIRVFISGNRPSMSTLLADSVQIAALDGRPADLGKGIPAALMPVVSAPYKNILRWNGCGKPDTRDLQNLQALVQQAHAEGKKVRLWAIPDKPKMWTFLLENGVDLINTDKLEKFSRFMKHQGRN